MRHGGFGVPQAPNRLKSRGIPRTPSYTQDMEAERHDMGGWTLGDLDRLFDTGTLDEWRALMAVARNDQRVAGRVVWVAQRRLLDQPLRGWESVIAGLLVRDHPVLQDRVVVGLPPDAAEFVPVFSPREHDGLDLPDDGPWT